MEVNACVNGYVLWGPLVPKLPCKSPAMDPASISSDSCNINGLDICVVYLEITRFISTTDSFMAPRCGFGKKKPQELNAE